MVLGKRFFTAIMLTVLLFGGLVKAQKDFISNQNDFGSYVGGQGAQNVIINNTFNQPLLFAPGTENLIQDSTRSNANFIGGALNEITTSGENELDAYNLLYGNNNSLNNSTSTGLIGHSNSSEYVTASAALGKGNTLSGKQGQNNLPQLFAIGNDNSIDEGNENVAIGTNNFIANGSNHVAIGENNEIQLSSNSFAVGENITMVAGENCGAIGQSHSITSNSNKAYSLGAFTRQGGKNRSLILGFGESFNLNESLTSVGDRSITIGTASPGGEVFNTLNIRPPSSNGDFVAPLVGIGTPDPDAKLNIVNRGATGGESTSGGVALRVERFIEDNDNEPLFNVRDNGAAGFNLPAKASPRAPYQFEESGLTPAGFPTGQGQANIVQNYAAFPNFKNVGPFKNGDSAKWLALGERPPASSTTNDDQVAYGLANVWQNNAVNFVLLDQSPGTSGQTAEKDLAITFQDVWNQSNSSALTDPTNAGNRIRFLFRNSNDIDDNNSKFELMSLEPTGEVGIGDYSRNSTQQANLEVKAETQGNGDPVFQVRNNGGPGSRGNLVMTANDDGNVGIDTSNPNRELVVNGKQYVNTNSGFSGSSGEAIIVDGGGYTVNGTWSGSDIRLKTDTQVLSNALSKIEKLNGYTYRFADNEYTAEMNTAEARQAGIIAQQLKSVLPEAVRKGKNGIYAVNYDAIIPLLIEANKSQQNKINQLQEKAQQVEKLKNQVEELQMQVQELTQQSKSGANQFENSNEENLNQKTVSIQEGENKGQAMLLQNRPNPYSGETIIPYFLPKDFNNANMLITNTNGQIIKRINLEKSGKGELTLRTEGLNSGQYLYSLIVDGRKIQTRKMIVNR